MNVKDKTGMRFGKLTVVARTDDEYAKNRKHIMWLCRCDCGNSVIVRSSNLNNAKSSVKSCGCFQKYQCRNNGITHGLSKSRLYKIYQGMISRCYTKNAPNYKLYGQRGIKVCDEWKNSFLAFYYWAISNGYSSELTLDRINNNGDYNPNNCRWATIIQQNNNKRNNRYITFNGETHTITFWSKKIGGKDSRLISDRLRRGWSIEKAVTTPVKGRRKNNG